MAHAVVLAVVACFRFGFEPETTEVPLADAVLIENSQTIEFEPFQHVDVALPALPVEVAAQPKRAGGQTVGIAMADPAIAAPRSSKAAATNQWEHALASQWHESDLIARFDQVGAAVGRFKLGGSGAGTGNGIGNGSEKGQEFFGLNERGKKFVYVIDGSKSMNRAHDSDAGTRFKRVKLELVKSISALPESAQFFILFFNDYAVTMPAPGLEPASHAAKLKHLQWMQQVITVGNTEPTAAMTMALKLKPDVIYFLSDGDFNIRVRKEMLELPVGDAVVQCFAFEEQLSEDMQRAFDLLEGKKPLAAQKAAKGNDYRKTLTAWRGQSFLRELAEKHGGKLVLIP